MKYEKSKKLSEKNLRRKCGIKQKIFGKVVEILKKSEAERRKRGGSKYEVVYIDTTESPVERPKMGKKITARKKTYPKNSGNS